MVVSYVLRSGRDFASLIGHQDRVGVLEFGIEQAIEVISEVNRGPSARATFSHADPRPTKSVSAPARRSPRWCGRRSWHANGIRLREIL